MTQGAECGIVFRLLSVDLLPDLGGIMRNANGTAVLRPDVLADLFVTHGAFRQGLARLRVAIHAESHQVSGREYRLVRVRMARPALNLLREMLGVSEIAFGREDFRDGLDGLIRKGVAIIALL